jgi:hypothetical protein
MKNLHILLSLIVLAGAGTACLAADNGDLAKKNAELQKRVEKLDNELQTLKKDVMQSSTSAPAQPPKLAWSDLDLQFYGYLKFDAAYNSARMDNGDYGKWVERQDTNSRDDQFAMTANETRLGMRLSGPDDGVMKTSGRVEVDFYGGGSENKANPMMRHAYIELDWPADRFSIIAGQTSDVISPLVPTTVNYSVCWWVGNIGYRRPQIRLTKEYEVGPQESLKLEGALSRTIGRDSVTGINSGEDSGLPTAQARVSMSLPLFGPKISTVGVSGHYGREEYDTAANGDNRKFTSWSLNLDVTHPVNEWLAIKSELFTGADLDSYLGGIGQGVTTSAGPNQYEAINSHGGWIAASLGPWDKEQFNVGVSMDNVNRGNVNDGDRTMNRAVFANMYYSLNKNTQWAVELSHWRTEYRGPGDGDSIRAQTSLIYKF